MLRPEDAPEPEQQKHSQGGLGGLMKGIFGGGDDSKNETQESKHESGSRTTSESKNQSGVQTTSESQSQASKIAQESKEARGSVKTTSSSAQSTNTYKVDTKESDEKWDQARAMTAKAQEEGRRAQTMTAEASATQRESAEAMRRAEVARGAEHELQAKMREVEPEVALKQYKETSERLDRAKKTSATKRSEIERLEREMAALNDEVNRKTALLQGEVDAAKAAQHDLEDLNNKIARTKEAAQQEEVQARDNRSAAEKLKEKAQAVRATAKAEEEAYGKAQSQVQELERQMEEAKRAADDARRKMAGAEHKAEDIESELSGYEEAAKHHASEAESDKARIPELEKAKDRAVAKLKDAQAKLDAASKDTQAKATSLQEREALAINLKDSLSKIQEQAKVKTAELARKKADHEKAQADLKPLQEEVERQRRIRVAEEKQAKSLEEEFRSIRIEADRAEARKEELWEKAKAAGETADRVVDEGYVKLGGDKSLTQQGKKTERVATQSSEKHEMSSGKVTSHEIKTKVEE